MTRKKRWPTSKAWLEVGSFQNGDGSKPWYLVNPKIAGKWMFIPLKMVCIGIDPYPNKWEPPSWREIPHPSRLNLIALDHQTANPRAQEYPGVPSSPKSVDVYHSLSKNMAGLYEINISQPTKCITLCTYGSLLHVHPASFPAREETKKNFLRERRSSEVHVRKGGSCNLLTSRCTKIPDP